MFHLRRRLWRLRVALRRIPVLTSGNPLPDVAPGTARLHDRIEAIAAVAYEGGRFAAIGIDLERAVPLVRLGVDLDDPEPRRVDGRLVDATTLRAAEHSARRVRGGKGDERKFSRPGTFATGCLPSGKSVVVVVTWTTALEDARALVRWRERGAVAFGVFDERSLEDKR